MKSPEIWLQNNCCRYRISKARNVLFKVLEF